VTFIQVEAIFAVQVAVGRGRLDQQRKWSHERSSRYSSPALLIGI
jgi:hypothetical protein